MQWANPVREEEGTKRKKNHCCVHRTQSYLMGPDSHMHDQSTVTGIQYVMKRQTGCTDSEISFLDVATCYVI